jgi:hypothetical protein
VFRVASCLSDVDHVAGRLLDQHVDEDSHWLVYAAVPVRQDGAGIAASFASMCSSTICA